MEIISVINQKGGVGKSTTSAAIASGLCKKGKKVLIIDLDAQGNISSTFPIKESHDGNNAFSVISKESDISSAIQSTPYGDVIPSTPALSGIDILFNNKTGREYQLKEVLLSAKLPYDYIVIDTPPALGSLTINALTASNSIIVPAQADVFSLQGIIQLYQTINAIQTYTNPSLKVRGIVLNRFNKRSTISKEILTLLENFAAKEGTKVYQTKIRECTALKEAQVARVSIFEYAPKCNAAVDYMNLVEEIIQEDK